MQVHKKTKSRCRCNSCTRPQETLHQIPGCWSSLCCLLLCVLPNEWFIIGVVIVEVNLIYKPICVYSLFMRNREVENHLQNSKHQKISKHCKILKHQVISKLEPKLLALISLEQKNLRKISRIWTNCIRAYVVNAAWLDFIIQSNLRINFLTNHSVTFPMFFWFTRSSDRHLTSAISNRSAWCFFWRRFCGASNSRLVEELWLGLDSSPRRSSLQFVLASKYSHQFNWCNMPTTQSFSSGWPFGASWRSQPFSWYSTLSSRFICCWAFGQ